MKMVYKGLKKKFQLPSRCPNSDLGLDSTCNASFKDGKNLYQDGDLIVHCVKCGISLGQFEPNTIPYKFKKNKLIMRDDNIG